jgi:phosphoribosylaminoimidazolecarboxamide formyltransferase/IMP cyclohydrolase
MSDIKAAYRTVMDDHFPPQVTITVGETVLTYRKRTWKLMDGGELVEKGLRYGENPGQEAALYELVGGNLSVGQVRLIDPGNGMVSALGEADMLQAGKHPGKTNLTDVDNALNILRHLTDRPAAAIMKHNNPSGVALAGDIASAYHRAFMADLIAAFGGAAVVNRPVDKVCAELMAELYLEVVAAPDYEEGALDILKKKSKNLRILRIARIDRLAQYRDRRFLDIKSLLDGGLILQTSSFNPIKSAADFLPARSEHQGRVYEPQRQPSQRELDDAVFGWAVEQGVSSNSVLYVKDGVTVGIGTGEQDRVGVARIAVYKAYTKYANQVAWERFGKKYDELALMAQRGEADPQTIADIDAAAREARAGLPGSVMISDAFFPFRDGVDVGLKEGVTCVVHPGGSLRDWESIEACNQAEPKAAMVFTGQRAFKH